MAARQQQEARGCPGVEQGRKDQQHHALQQSQADARDDHRGAE